MKYLLVLLIGFCLGGIFITSPKAQNNSTPVKFYLGDLPSSCNDKLSMRVTVNATISPSGTIPLWLCVEGEGQ